jgi:hypothetical protein
MQDLRHADPRGRDRAAHGLLVPTLPALIAALAMDDSRHATGARGFVTMLPSG